MPVTKRYNAQHHRDAEKGEDAVINWLWLVCNYSVTPHPKGPMGVDLLCEGHGDKFYVEVETRRMSSWERGRFNFDPIHVPLRRDRYGSLDARCFYITLRADLELGLVVEDSSLQPERIDYITSRHKTKGGDREMMYHVPLAETSYVYLTRKWIAPCQKRLPQTT